MNDVQWQAVAEWMCQGGVVFVHHESSPLIDRLIEAAPLDADQSVQSDGFVTRNVGLGSMREYSQDLLATEGAETGKLIAQTIAVFPQYSSASLVSAARVGYGRSGKADKNRILVLSFFGCYMLFSGVVSLLLFRLNRRRIAIYISVVVAVSSFLSVALGGILRVSQGDLRWVTVTQAGAGGVVQVGKVQVQSAGGRSTQVGVAGYRSDLQRIESNQQHNRYYYGYGQSPQSNYAPFTWQPSLVSEDSGIYQVDVPMVPWGTEHLHATAYGRETPRLDVELGFTPKDPATDAENKDDDRDQSESLKMPAGQFSVKVTNHLPVAVNYCRLVFAATLDISDQADTYANVQSGQYQWYQQQYGTPKDGLIDIYHIEVVYDIAAGKTRTKTFEADFVAEGMNGYWNLNQDWERGSLMMPKLSRMDTTSAWIVGRLSESPVLQLDERHNEFTLQENGLHLFIQELRPEDMPDASLFLSPEATLHVPDEHGTSNP